VSVDGFDVLGSTASELPPSGLFDSLREDGLLGSRSADGLSGSRPLELLSSAAIGIALRLKGWTPHF